MPVFTSSFFSLCQSFWLCLIFSQSWCSCFWRLYIVFSHVADFTGINCYGDNQSIVEPGLDLEWNLFSLPDLFLIFSETVEVGVILWFISSDVAGTIILRKMKFSTFSIASSSIYGAIISIYHYFAFGWVYFQFLFLATFSIFFLWTVSVWQKFMKSMLYHHAV